MITREQAKDLHMKLELLAYADIFSTGVVKIGDGYGIQVVLRKPTQYGMPDTLDGVPLI